MFHVKETFPRKFFARSLVIGQPRNRVKDKM
jgi:hypothetical protein